MDPFASFGNTPVTLEEPRAEDMDSSLAVDDDGKAHNVTDPSDSIVQYVMSLMHKAETARLFDEQRWLEAYRNYRGVYSPETQWRSDEKSKVFVKVTKTKVLAAYGQIIEVLFGNHRFPLTVDPTLKPEGVEENVHIETNPELAEATNDFALLPGETHDDWSERLGGMAKKLEPVEDSLRAGMAPSPSAVNLSPSLFAAKKMQLKIHDQLDESNASKELRSAAFECALLGTGIMKGPFAEDKEYPKWSDTGAYTPVVKTIPKTNYVSVWNFYPDPDGNNMDTVEYTIERHKMSKTDMRRLKRRPMFDEDKIELAIDYGPSYIEKWWETQLDDNDSGASVERFEVLEFWGYVDTEMLEQYDIDVPEELSDNDQLQANVWVCNGVVLRMVLNPFKPQRIPYQAFPYELNPYSFFGVGLAENMADTQLLMNGFMRMAVDNAALSGSLMIEVDSHNLAPGQDMEIYPGKIWERQAGAPGQAIFGTTFPNVSNENMQMFDKARVLADESTGFPSFAHGQTGVSGVGRTASGISMLMGAAHGSIRTVVSNVDDYLLMPLGTAFFAFNMQFDFDPEIKGDLEVKARGTESLMASEVRSQRLLQFLGVVQAPTLAPFARMDYLIKEIAKAMDLDPDKAVNTLSDAAIQAEMLKKWTEQNPQPAQPQAGPATPETATQEGMGAPDPMDPTGAGGGNIGTGMAPQPSEPGFTGTAGGTGEPL